MNLLLSRNRKTFHKPGCAAMGYLAKPWKEVKNLTYLQVLETTHGLGIYPCGRCLPPTYMPLPEER